MKKTTLLLFVLFCFCIGLKAQKVETHLAYKNRIVRHYDGRHHWFVDIVSGETLGENYEWAQSYDNNGLAKVKRNGKDYLLNTKGQEFEYADNLEKITSSTTAFIFRGQTINGQRNYKIPKELFNRTQLKILVIDAKTPEIPKEIGNLVNLEILIINAPVANLPKEISNLIKLKKLSVSSYKGEALPVEIGNLKQLTKLSLTGYKLKNVPVELGQLTELKLLLISVNVNTVINFRGWLENLHNLESLNLSCGFEQAPLEISKLTGLKCLYLSGAKLKGLPQEFSALQQLEYLDANGAKLLDISSLFNAVSGSSKDIIIDAEAKINYNSTILLIKPPKFNVLPSEIGNLKNLVELNLKGVKKIPVEIGALSKLKKMAITYISDSTLPVEIGELKALEFFSVQSSRIKELPKEFAQLQSLKIFELKSSKLTEFPEEVYALKNLEQIDVSKNLIKGISAEITALPKLKSLGLMGNKELDFKSICNAYEKTTKTLALGTLGLKSIPIKTDLLIAIDYKKKISPEIAKLKHIIVLDVTTDSIPVLKAIATLPQLSYLLLRSPKTTVLPAQLWNLASLTGLNLTMGKGAVIPAEILNLNKLETLTIKSAELAELPKTIGKLRQLKIMDLSGCKLNKLPKSMGKLKALQSINLSWNQVTTLPKSMKKLKNLEILDLSGNKIEHLPIVITKMKKLKDLKVLNNPLITLPKGMKNLTGLMVLNLEGMEELDFVSLCNAFEGYSKNLEITNVQHASNANFKQLTIKAKCNLTGLPAEIGKLENLVSLRQTYTKIKTVPDELVKLKYLKVFQITKLPKEEVEKAKSLLPAACAVR